MSVLLGARRSRVAIALTIFATLILGMIPDATLGRASAEPSETPEEGIVLTHTAHPSTNQDPRAFKTGETMTSVVGLKANLSTAEYAGAYLSISVPQNSGRYLGSIDTNIDFSSSEVFSNLRRVSASEYRIALKDSDDARDAEFALLTKFASWVTPDGYEMPVTVSLHKADGSVVKTTESVVYKALAGDASYSYKVVGGVDQYGGLATDAGVLDPKNLTDVTFRYEPSFYVWHDYDRYSVYADEIGRRLYQPLELVQPLPEYAAFDPAKNPGWTLDSSTQKVTYTFEKKDFNNQNYRPVELKLRFPNAPVNQDFTTTSTMTFHQKDPGASEQPVVSTLKVHYRFKKSLPGSPIVKQFEADSSDNTSLGRIHWPVTNISTRLDKGLKWDVFVKNHHAVPLTITEFTDHDLDSRLYYTGIQLPYDGKYDFVSGLSPDNYQTIRSMNVQGVLDDGSLVELGTVRRGGTLTFPRADIAKRVVRLNFVLPSGYVLNREQYAMVKVITKFRDAPIMMEKPSENQYSNSATYAGTHTSADGTSTYSVRETGSDYFTLVPRKIDVGLKKSLSDKLSFGWFASTREDPTRGTGERAIWEISSDLSIPVIKGLANNEFVENLEFVDLLPEGVEYNEQETLANSRSVTRAGGTITYISNYQDSGLNAVVIGFKRIRVSALNNLFDNSGALLISTKVTSDSLPGTNTNTVLVKIDGQFIAADDQHHMGGFFKESYSDTRDIDGDGDTKESFAASHASYKYVAKQEVIARTYIAREKVDNFTKEGLQTGPGNAFRYKLYNYNNKASALKKYELVDVFPHSEDYSSAKDATTNTYLPRNSQFSNTLTGPVTLTVNGRETSKFTVLYTTDIVTGIVETPATSLNWVENIDDYAKVTGIKVVLKDGQEFKTGEYLEAFATMRAPESSELTARAHNNFAISTDGGDFVPTNLVYNEIYTPSSTLIITKITEVGGQKVPLKGAVFTITSTVDPNVKFTVTTGEDGTVTQVLPLAKDGGDIVYTVSETQAPEGYLVATNSRDITVKEDETATLEVTNQPRTVTVTKVDAHSGQVVEGAQFELRNDEGSVVGGRQTTDGKGIARFSTVPSGTYSLVEVEAPDNYLKLTGPIPVTVGVDNVEVAVENTPIPTRVIHAKKTWVGGSQVEHPDIRLQLMRTLSGNSQGQPEPVPSYDLQKPDQNGNVTWEGVQTKVADGRDYTFSVREVTEDGETFASERYRVEYGTDNEGIFTVTNTFLPPTDTVTAKKVWVDGPTDKPTVFVRLFRSLGAATAEPVPGAEVKSPGADGSVFWSDVDHTDSDGTPYTFSVRETNKEGALGVPNGYEVSYSTAEDGTLMVTNTFVPQTMSVKGQKLWVGGSDSDHGDVVLQLRRAVEGGEPENIGEPVTTKDLSVRWSDVPATDLQGREYTYSVVEPTVPASYEVSYSTAEDGTLMVTNTFVPDPEPEPSPAPDPEPTVEPTPIPETPQPDPEKPQQDMPTPQPIPTSSEEPNKPRSSQSKLVYTGTDALTFGSVVVLLVGLGVGLRFFARRKK